METKLTDLILHIPNFLSEEDCQTLIYEFESNKDKVTLETSDYALTGKIDVSTFKAHSVTNEQSEAYKLCFFSTEQVINQYHDYLDKFEMFHVKFRNALKFSHKFRILKYDVGASIHAHIDDSAFCYASCTINLNEGYEGGDFAFFRQKYNIKLGRGDALIFPADYFWVHEVLPITKGIRYSLNSFLLSIHPYAKNYVNKTLDDYNRNILPNLKQYQIK